MKIDYQLEYRKQLQRNISLVRNEIDNPDFVLKITNHALKSLVSNPNQINPKELSQEDINNELIISKLEIYDGGNLIRTESFNNGVIISSGDVKQLVRCKKINDIGI